MPTKEAFIHYMQETDNIMIFSTVISGIFAALILGSAYVKAHPIIPCLFAALAAICVTVLATNCHAKYRLKEEFKAGQFSPRPSC